MQLRKYFLVLFFLVWAPVYAEEIKSTQLEEINRQVEERSAELEVFQTKQKELEDGLKTIGTSLSRAQDKEKSLIANLEITKKERGVIEDRLTDLKWRYDRLRKAARQRVRSLYIFKTQGGLEDVLFRQEGEHLSKAMVYVSAVGRYDVKLLNTFADLQREIEIERGALTQRISQQQDLQRKLQVEREGIEQKRNRQKQLLNENKTKRAEVEQILAMLKAQALRLETVMASITSGTEEIELEEKPEPTPEASEEKTALQISLDGIKRGDPGLGRPIEGKVVSPFGAQSAQDFSSLVRSKGIEYAAAEAAKIFAIAPGRVAFVGTMPGYGTTIVLDHGKRTYSVYARIDKPQASISELVAKGQELGSVGALDQKGRNFYFEIRENSRPVNPEAYFPSASKGK